MARHTVRPTVLRDFLDDMAVEADLEMKRKGLRSKDLKRLVDWQSPDRRRNFNRYVDGGHHDLGPEAVARVGEALGIPMRFLCGRDAVLADVIDDILRGQDEASRHALEALQPILQRRKVLAAPSMVPALKDLSGVAA